MVLRAIDSDTLRSLELHETRVHALPGRQVEDLGDAILLFDPRDPEPFWNRAAALTWPADGAAFDRRIDELMTLFATLDRLPHIWPRVVFNEPPDLIDRLYAAGFEEMGRGMIMVLEDHDRATASRPDPGKGLEVIQLREGPGIDVRPLVREFALVLCEAFSVEPDRRASIETEALAQVGIDVLQLYVVRVGGEPAAIAKRATFDGASYLSSIGTRPAFRGKGLGALVTSMAVEDALRAGSRWVHLGVFADNIGAQRMYEKLGFVAVGEPVPDLLLRR
jgi:ribosomal protein S18 acetylase RimI-like enzyme